MIKVQWYDKNHAPGALQQLLDNPSAESRKIRAIS